MIDHIANPPLAAATSEPPIQQSQQQQQPTLSQPIPAQPPSKSEIERKLSFRSASAPSSRMHESPKKKKSTHPPPPHAPSGTYHTYSASGNESDSSSITSSTQPPMIGSPNPTSPILTPATTSVGGLSAIAERKFGGEIIDEAELEDVEEENENENENEEVESASEAEEEQGLQKGMEGERVVKSGYLWKKQERRKAWKKRWFVLRTEKLAYYKDEKEYSLKKVIDLHEVHTVAPVTVKKHPHSFGIVTPKRTFFAKASHQDDMEEWVRAINGVRRKLSEREEEERTKREKGEHHHHQHQQKSSSIPIPSNRERSTSEHVNDTTSPGTSVATSGSYFVNRPNQQGIASPQAIHAAGHVSPSLASGGVIPPSSPMDTTNSLASQMAKMSIPTRRTTSAQSVHSYTQAQSSSGLMAGKNPSTAGSVQSSRSVSGPSPSTTARREPSASSIASSIPAGTGDRPMALNLQSSGIGSGSNQFVVSSEDEDDIDLAEASQGRSVNDTIQSLPSTPIDPTKVILSAYLMKRSKGRGRKVWRKRWFVLTSQGFTYTKSHMDTKALRFIPLTSVLDALEVDASDESLASSEEDRPPSHHNHNPFHPHSHQSHQSHIHAQTSTSPPAKQNFTTAMRGRLSSNDAAQSATPRKQPSLPGGSIEKHSEENIFRLITAKRTYVLCAPSEEDEIKWLAATRALLNQLRVTQQQQQPLSPTMNQGQGQGQGQIPTITQQPPTPAASLSERPIVTPTPQRSNSQSGIGSGESQGQPQPTPTTIQRQISSSSASGFGSVASGQTPGSMTRGRSATYMAKSAVADVVKKFHPET
ncbi:hypothetical protein I203_102404 [Kwoniella mangroviensis CBS 8507]|uniref:uncharacterized protein n=1 Tax=Kwoniella mangroviensis CBS 8507 TaxID=1296122 RepID=UPI00080D086B|nr:uncharacterized protein I203_06525 [Kwoniella mangroviensis CBS 8507]OCF64344.1 hypothetical protein I203_06525 [Kwoniella mangroviensis CBS 8507]